MLRRLVAPMIPSASSETRLCIQAESMPRAALVNSIAAVRELQLMADCSAVQAPCLRRLALGPGIQLRSRHAYTQALYASTILLKPSSRRGSRIDRVDSKFAVGIFVRATNSL